MIDNFSNSARFQTIIEAIEGKLVIPLTYSAIVNSLAYVNRKRDHMSRMFKYQIAEYETY